jgi:PIN domain nuclease of toxin-antitoxin system
MALTVLDASVVIAFLDAQDAHHQAARSALAERQFVADLGIGIEPLTAPIARRAAALRARHAALRLPDALVLATADALDAPVLTADRAWTRVSRRARVL